MPDAPNTERRVWVLPSELMTRLRDYQSDNEISSEVEVARRLLGYALDMKEKPTRLVARLQADYAKTKSLRITAQSILAPHPQVLTLRFSDRAIEYELGLPVRPPFMLKMEA